MNGKLDAAASLDLALKTRGKDDSFAVAVRTGKQNILTSASPLKDEALKVLQVCVEVQGRDENAARLLMMVAAAIFQPPLCMASMAALHALATRVSRSGN